MTKPENFPSQPAFSLCVYCGSRPGARPQYSQAAEAVGKWIAAHGGQLIYGGGRNGLMGVVADTCLAAGGRVVGIIPEALRAREWAHTGCTELHIVETMAERKQMMIAKADAFLALPGGIGTMEEMFEAWTLSTLGYQTKPVGLLNLQGYFDGLLAQLRHCGAEGFLSEAQRDALQVGENPATLCEALVDSGASRP